MNHSFAKAVQICEEGLFTYPDNVDLLADAIKYSAENGDKPRAQMHYEKADAEDFWNEVKSRMFLAGISSLYIEGGAEIFESVCKARAAEFAFEYVAPKIIGDGGLPAFKNGKNFSIEPWEERRLGEDSLTFGKIAWTR